MKVAWFAPPLIHTEAQRLGLIGQAGLSFEGIVNRSSDEQFEFLQSGHVDAVVTAMDNVIIWNRRLPEADLRIVAEIEGVTGISLVARPEFETISALQGKRLLVDSVENGFVIALRALLAEAGVAFDQCQITPAGGVIARLDGMLAGNGDATLLGTPFTEMAEQKGLRRLADVEKRYPTFPGQGVVARLPVIERKAEEFRLWFRALDEAHAHCRADPSALVKNLVNQGTHEAIAAKLSSFVGDSLVPKLAGVQLLIEHRRMLGLPGGEDSAASMLDLRLLEA